MRPHALASALLFLLAACGGSADPAQSTTPAAPAAPSWSERAARAWSAGDLDAAEGAADNALQLDASDERALEVAARVALARGRIERAIRALASATSPELVRLRARAYVRLGNFAAVARDLEALGGDAEREGWGAAMLPIARAAAGRDVYTISGADRVFVPMRAGAPLPLVEITIDGERRVALIATSADLTVIDDQRREASGLAREIRFGELSVASVPVLVRDIGEVGQRIGTDIDAVIGTDLLARLHATIDGRDHTLVVRRAPEASTDDAAEAPYLQIDGSFLVIPSRIEGTTLWLGVDTAGMFPIALSSAAVDRLGRDPSTFERVPNAPSDDIRVTTLAAVELGSARIEEVPAVTGLVPANLAEQLGAPVAGMIGGQVWSQVAITFDASARVLRIR